MIAFLRNLVTQDFWLKLFSLALAVLIWVTLSITKEGGFGNRTSEETYHVPVRIVSASTDVSAFHADPELVRIKVRGTTHQLDELQAGDIRAFVDLTSLAPLGGTNQRIQVAAPVDLTILEVEPEEAKVIAPAHGTGFQQ